MAKTQAAPKILSVSDLVALCEEYAKLGWAVQRQAVDCLVNGEPYEEQNPSALSEIRSWLSHADRLGVNGACIRVEDITEVIG